MKLPMFILLTSQLLGQVVYIPNTDPATVRALMNSNFAWLDANKALGMSGTTLPANCTIGQLFTKTNATAGSNVYVALATGSPCTTWTQQQGGGGAPAPHAATHASGGSDPVTPGAIGAEVPLTFSSPLVRTTNTITCPTCGGTGSSGWTRDTTNGILTPSVTTDKLLVGGTLPTTQTESLALVATTTGNYSMGLYAATGALAGQLWATPSQLTINYAAATNASNNWLVLRAGGAANKIYWGDDGTKAWMQTPHALNFLTGNAGIPTPGLNPQFTLNTNGNAGIGIATPATSLHVAGTTPTVRVGDTSLAGCLELGNSDGSAGINYLTVLNGTLTVTTTKPAACQ